jgi:cyclophilin family peptidyl-prolyl cis-trans isomerase
VTRSRLAAASFLALPLVALAQSSAPRHQFDSALTSIALAADRRAANPGDAELIELGLVNGRAEVRRFAVLSLGRMERAELVAAIAPMLEDGDALVRAEAANAVAQSLHNAQPDVTRFARELLTKRLAAESDPAVISVLLRALGRIRHDPLATAEVAQLTVDRATGTAVQITGAVHGLESLIRRAPKLPVSDAVRTRLRALAVTGAGDADTSARIRRLALQTLLGARDDDVRTIEQASSDADWQVRRIAVQMMNPAVEVYGPGLERARRDPAFQVRIEALRVSMRGGGQARGCRALLDATVDAVPHVAIQAVDLLTPACPEKDDVAKRLASIASTLGTAGASAHLAAHALASLAAMSRDAARPMLAGAAQHPEWHVRAAAARAASAAGDEDTLVRLAGDKAAVVQEAALAGLAAMKSAALADAAIATLQSADHHVVRTAANVLAATPARDRAVPALLAALDRVTKTGADTSRDPRAAILRRLQELGTAELAPKLQPYVRDFDRTIAAQAADVIAKWSGDRPSPQPATRPAEQATATELAKLPTRLVLDMAEGGRVEIELFPDVAPLTVARVARLAARGYYNGLTFHRIALNFVVQGGSPGASEYVGDARYMRDEIGLLSHERGTVGISTRGRDTGDAQLFINLVDSPRLDYDYTVFGRVVGGMDVVDRMLEGAVIKSARVGN